MGFLAVCGGLAMVILAFLFGMAEVIRSLDGR